MKGRLERVVSSAPRVAKDVLSGAGFFSLHIFALG